MLFLQTGDLIYQQQREIKISGSCKNRKKKKKEKQHLHTSEQKINRNTKTNTRTEQGRKTKHQAGLVLCIKVALNSLKTKQPGKRNRKNNKKQLSSLEENTCFLFSASTLTSMFSPFHLDAELGCPSPGCNVPDLGPALLCKHKLLAVKGSHS